MRAPLVLTILAILCGTVSSSGADAPLHERIDALIAAGSPGETASPTADDAEFLRRVYLDLAGRIPSTSEAAGFLNDAAPEKRAGLIRALLNGPDYPRRMQELFHVMLMERLGEHAGWEAYLRASFAANKPWDQLVRELLSGKAADESTRGAVFFLSKRLEHYGENPVDYPALTRDVGRLFLGVDLRCAQCHDHLFINDYKQADFQGLHAFFQNVELGDAKTPTVVEKPTLKRLEYMSVFKKVARETGPRVPGLVEIEVPPIKPKEEYITPPDPKTKTPGVLKFSPLARLAEQLPSPENPAFARNAVNRLWFVMMGRGLVHPLDLTHGENPPSHPELLDLLANDFVAHKFDVRWLLEELALSHTYQRSSQLPDGRDEVQQDRFLTALEKRLSAEQLSASVIQGLGAEGVDHTALRGKFVKAFANAPREPEEEPSASLRAALFLENDPAVLDLLKPKDSNLVGRLSKLADDVAVTDELYLAVLTRRPTGEERTEAAAFLATRSDQRVEALGQLAWALIASAEFGVNH